MRGICRYYLGEFNGSLQDFQESLTLKPDNPIVLAWKFQAEQALRQIEPVGWALPTTKNITG
jgi:hypothetical protein